MAALAQAQRGCLGRFTHRFQVSPSIDDALSLRAYLGEMAIGRSPHPEKVPAMNATMLNLPAGAGYELRFRSLFNEGRGFRFPCDAGGHVDLDELSERARDNYFFAHSVIGRDVAMPVVCVHH